MAVTDYQITPAGHAKVLHNGVAAYAGRKISLDSNSPVLAVLLKYGYVTASVAGGAKYHTDPANLQTYTVQASGAGKLLHATSGSATTPLGNGATLSLDPQDANTALLLQRGWIV